MKFSYSKMISLVPWTSLKWDSTIFYGANGLSLLQLSIILSIRYSEYMDCHFKSVIHYSEIITVIKTLKPEFNIKIILKALKMILIK